jgi:hypothetical protein
MITRMAKRQPSPADAAACGDRLWRKPTRLQSDDALLAAQHALL